MPTAYSNVVPRESTYAGGGEKAKNEGIVVDEFDSLADHEVLYMFMGLETPPHGINSINHANLSSFFEIMNIIIANNIDNQLYKTEVSTNWAQFMIRVTFGVCIDLVR